MSIKAHFFSPHYRITDRIAKALMRIEACKQAIITLPITPSVLAKLRETSKYQTVHYSTMIEGNRLTQAQVKEVIEQNHSVPGRERDEEEVKGYFAALEELQGALRKKQPITEELIQRLHALVISGGRQKVTPTEYRSYQNVIKESGTGAIVYLPPEAQDVPSLMKGLVEWINKNQLHMPNPILAAVAHYQFATIHPYLDGNGRTARLLATYIVHKGGCDLKGIYCLDEYYAKDIQAYYNALTIGPSHNYYMGRETADITRWIEYFCVGMAEAFERVHMRAEQAAESGVPAQSMLLRELDDRQRKALCLLEEYSVVTTIQLADLFGIAERTARAWCTQWVKQGFLHVADPSRRARKYILAPQFLPLISK